jgi:cell wall-associated NlpC family hydrolase
MDENYGENIIKEANTWIGTPYKHFSSVKGAGADCALFIMRVYANCGLIKYKQPEFYANDWSLHNPKREIFREIVLQSCHQIEEKQLKKGDIILYQFGKAMSHGAILMDNDMIIHSEVDVGVTVANRGYSVWTKREREYYTYGR